MKNMINKEKLIEEIKQASFQVRFLGVLPFNIDWDEFKEKWYNGINDGLFKVSIICEAPHFVNLQSIIASDKRVSGESRSYEVGSFTNILAEPEEKLRKYLLDKKCKNIEPKDDIKKDASNYIQCFSLRTCYLQIPIPAVNIDDKYYIAISLTKFVDHDRFELIDDKHLWKDEFKKYFETYFDKPHGAEKYSTEITSKGNRLEVIQAFNESRIPVGLLPRDSFLSTVQVKYVVWALIFTRDGKLLIHKRKDNAKDNRGMWDKSVGGHVSLHDADSAKAVARELAEELFKQEASDQGDYDKSFFFKANPDKLKFLGEWLPNIRYIQPFSDVNRHMKEYYYFRLNYQFSSVARNSPRLLPSGNTEDVSVFADVYVCIAEQDFKIIGLENSDYMILELHELKDAFNTKKIIRDINGKEKIELFEVSPDLKSIIRSSIWDELSSFSDYVKKNYGREAKTL